MKRPLLVVYGLTVYLLFNASFLYMVGFLTEFAVPKAVNDGVVVAPWEALAVNAFLVFLFGFFHSLMARKEFKRVWTRIIPAEAERSTYVLQSAVFLGLVMACWQPLTSPVWSLQGAMSLLAYGVCGTGVILVLVSTFLIDHFELFGLRQCFQKKCRWE